MSLIKSSRKILAQNLNVLMKTKHIEDKDLKSAAWKMLAAEYSEHKDSTWVEKALISMLNAIIYQQAIAFILTRDCFRNLCREDRNWNRRIGLKNGNWKTLILEAVKRDFIRLAYQTSDGIRIYLVINETILEHLSVDPEKQFKLVKEYAEQNKNKHLRHSDKRGDVEAEEESERKEAVEKAQVEGLDNKPSVSALSFNDSIFSKEGTVGENARDLIEQIHLKILASPWPQPLKSQFQMCYERICDELSTEEEVAHFMKEYVRQYDCNSKEPIHFFSSKRIKNIVLNEEIAMSRRYDFQKKPKFFPEFYEDSQFNISEHQDGSTEDSFEEQVEDSDENES